MVSFRPDSTDIEPKDAERPMDKTGKELNRLPARVKAALFLGQHYEYSVEVAGVLLKAISRSMAQLPPDTPVYVTVAQEHCLALPHSENKA
jgi:hypothetical protein